MLRTLRDSDFSAILAAFTSAFSDYVVPLTPTAEQLREMMARRGFVPELSVGWFEGEEIASFVLNAWSGDSGYNMGTGTRPSHRKKGLSRRLMERSFELLRDRGAARYVLEVIESNEPAAALYRHTGFAETRRFQCWSYSGPGDGIGTVENPDWNLYRGWWDVQPSWQNSVESVLRARDRYLVVGDHRGYAVVFPSNGDLAQLAVHGAHRRRGIGRRLLGAAAAAAGKPLRILNIDDSDPEIARFLESCGAVRTVRQIEMVVASC
jgi:GNAT superfamily N-acetyltransferase